MFPFTAERPAADGQEDSRIWRQTFISKCPKAFDESHLLASAEQETILTNAMPTADIFVFKCEESCFEIFANCYL